MLYVTVIASVITVGNTNGEYAFLIGITAPPAVAFVPLRMTICITEHQSRFISGHPFCGVAAIIGDQNTLATPRTLSVAL